MSRSNNDKKRRLKYEAKEVQLSHDQIVELTEAGRLPFAALHLRLDAFESGQRFMPQEIAATFTDVAAALHEAGKEIDITSFEIKHMRNDEEYTIGFFARIISTLREPVE